MSLTSADVRKIRKKYIYRHVYKTIYTYIYIYIYIYILYILYCVYKGTIILILT